MANALGAGVETLGLKEPDRPPPRKMTHEENLRRIVTGRGDPVSPNSLTPQQRKDIMNQAFTENKFKAVKQVQKAKEKLTDDITREINLIKELQEDLDEFGWEGNDKEMSKLAIQTLISQAEKQIYSKIKTGKLKLELGPGELLAGADIISRGLEMGGGYHIGATHDKIDEFWNDTKLNYIPVVGGIAESLSHIVGSIYNNFAVNVYGKESDDQKAQRIMYKLKGAETRLNSFLRDTKRLEIESNKYVNAEKSRYHQQREKLTDILNKSGPLTIQDEAYINLERNRDFY